MTQIALDMVPGRGSRRFTVDEYHRMIQTGILGDGEPVELLNGELVQKDRSAQGEDPISIGGKHAWVISRLVQLDAQLRRSGCYMRVQSPILIPPYNEPEPDGAIVVGTEDDYVEQPPLAAQTRCVIEAADSSLSTDRTTKLSVYASAGIPLYLIINIGRRCIEVYTQPVKEDGRYGEVSTLTANKRLELPTAGKPISIPAKRLIP